MKSIRAIRNVASENQIFLSSSQGIAEHVRAQVDAGELAPGELLPSVRSLATKLGVDKNTVAAAYQILSRTGIVVSRGRKGTRVADPAPAVEHEGFNAPQALRDLGDGNPDPRWFPDIARVLSAPGASVLYGEAVLEERLMQWAIRWMADSPSAHSRISLTNGAVDAVERLLHDALRPGDSLGLEDPCFLSSISTVRLAGYQPIPIPVDSEGMTVEGLERALAAGVRAVVCTPRAHNPTGASTSVHRAITLRRAFEAHPDVLIIEDDHYALLARTSYNTVVPKGHRRWALVRSVSKAIGPDLRVAIISSDQETWQRLAARLSGGTSWVSHILQRIVADMLSHPDSKDLFASAAEHYRERNDTFRALLLQRGVNALPGDGLSVWIECDDPQALAGRLELLGWSVRTEEKFRVDSDDPGRHVRATIHRLNDEELRQLAIDVSSASARSFH